MVAFWGLWVAPIKGAKKWTAGCLNLAKTRRKEQQQKNQQIEKQKKTSNQRGQASALHYTTTYCYHYILQLLYDGLVPGRIAGYANHNNIMNKSHILMRSLCYVDHTQQLK